MKTIKNKDIKNKYEIIKQKYQPIVDILNNPSLANKEKQLQIENYCISIKMDLDINEPYYKVEHLEDFQTIEIISNFKDSIDILIIQDLHLHLLNMLDKILYRLQIIPYTLAHINLKIYFNTVNFNNASKHFYFFKQKDTQNIDVVLHFLEELNSLIEIYSINAITKVTIKIIYGTK